MLIIKYNDGTSTNISKDYDLYELYNDFVSIDDETHDCTPELKETIEFIREYYVEIYEEVPKKEFNIDDFESWVKENFTYEMINFICDL